MGSIVPGKEDSIKIPKSNFLSPSTKFKKNSTVLRQSPTKQAEQQSGGRLDFEKAGTGQEKFENQLSKSMNETK